MEYNYYPAQPGHPPPPPPPQAMLNHQHDCSPMGAQMIPNGPQTMMHSSPAQPPPPNMRHTPGPSPMQHPISQQQHMAPHPHMQPMPPQQQPSPHLNYHQLPPHTPLSNSASPHPSTTPIQQQQPSRPSTGASPMHQQSPVHMNGPSPKIHPSMTPQQMNQIPSGPMVHPSQTASGGGQYSPHPGGVMNNHHHHHHPNGPPPPQPSQNFINVPIPPHHPNSHYSHQPPPSMNHHHHPHHQGHPMGQMHPHGPPGPPPLQPPPHHHHHHHHPGGPLQPPPPPGAYMPPSMERGSPFYPHIPQTEYRIIELNKRLQQRPKPLGPSTPIPTPASVAEDGWWERFACEFFDDNATLTLQIPGDVKPIEYTIGRTLIPRYFRSCFDGGVIDLSIKLRNIIETPSHSGILMLECNQTDITTKHITANMHVVVHTGGSIKLEFVSNNFDNNLLIRSWRFYTRDCHEYVERSMTPNEQLANPITRYGLTKSTVSYLKMCMIMEPMKELMCHHRLTKKDPRSCLKHLLQDKYKINSIEDNRAQPNKRRKRKAPGTTGVGAAGGGPNKRNKANSMNNNNPMGNNNNIAMNNSMIQTQPSEMAGVPNLPLASQDVLQVSEPSMLGADFVDDNERRITRLENNQFDRSLLNGNNNSSSSSSSNTLNPTNPAGTNNNNNSNGNNVNGGNKNQISQNQNQMNNNHSASNQNENLSTTQNNDILSNQSNHDGCDDYQSMPNNTNTNYHNNISTNNGSGNGTISNNSNNNNPTDNNNEINDIMNDNSSTLPLPASDGVHNNNGNNDNNGCPQGGNNNNNDESDNYQMSMMMNGNLNHMNHVIKSEMDGNMKQPMTTGSYSSQTDQALTESETR